MRHALLTLLALSLVAGCKARPTVGHFGDNAFYASRDHYRVRYLDGEEPHRTLLPAGWRITNFELRRDGAPDVPRGGAGAEEIHELPGRRGRASRERVPYFELRYAHEDGSVIFVRSVPVPVARSPRALLYDYVQRSAQSPAAHVRLLGASAPGSHFAWRTLREGPARVDDHDAHYATLEATTARHGRARSYVTLIAVPPGERPWGGRSPSRMLIIVGLSAHPLVHETHRPALASFASRLDVAR